MSEKVYRFECDGLGIYAAVDRDCPRDDLRREGKPDGSWLPRVGSDYPGAVSFWKLKGLDLYQDSGLRDWHLSVVKGETRFIVAERPTDILYEDELQVIFDPTHKKVLRDYLIEYCGNRPFRKPKDERPHFLRHHNSVRDWCEYSAYPQSDETFSYYAALGAKLGLERIAVNHEILRPGKRSSWPHAHKIEEELVYVLSGEPDVWINGELFRSRVGDLFLFPFDSGLAHTVINNSDVDVEIMVLGEQDAEPDWIFYPMHPQRNEECREKGWLWEDHPKLKMGDNSGKPGDLSGVSRARYQYSVNAYDLEAIGRGDRHSEKKVFYQDRDLARKIGTKRIAFHHVVLPSGCRSSLPRAESLEENFVYVLKGSPFAWVNGTRYAMNEGDGIAFPAGTGTPHTIINESGEDVELVITGELAKAG